MRRVEERNEGDEDQPYLLCKSGICIKETTPGVSGAVRVEFYQSDQDRKKLQRIVINL
jgi:hypothetical protein